VRKRDARKRRRIGRGKQLVGLTRIGQRLLPEDRDERVQLRVERTNSLQEGAGQLHAGNGPRLERGAELGDGFGVHGVRLPYRAWLGARARRRTGITRIIRGQSMTLGTR